MRGLFEAILVFLGAFGVLVLGCSREKRDETGGSVSTAQPSHVQILLRHDVLMPGSASELGILIELAGGWHTYADPPGDSGMAPRLSISWPDGMAAGDLMLPAHDTFRDAAGATYGFENAVLVRVPFTVAPSLAPGTEFSVTGKLDFLICKDACLPRSAPVDVMVRIGETQEENKTWLAALRTGGWKGE